MMNLKWRLGLISELISWRRAGEEYDPACLNTPPRRKFEIMIWGCISYNGVGTPAFVEGNLNSKGYQNILDKKLS